ncbi:MAG: hypothetical protein Roseis2KO_48010 [Roseivirga sp.]
MRVYLLILLALALLWPMSKAQEFQVTYSHIGVKDGLAGATVYCAFQDRDGYIWFGTETGVSRYDGKGFENFTTSEGLADNEVFKIVQDRLGRIWFSAFNGQLSYFFEGQFYNASNTAWLAEVEVNSYFVDLLLDSSGILWLSTVVDGVISIKTSGEVHYYKENLAKGGGTILLRQKGDSVRAIHVLYGDIALYEDMEEPELLPQSAESGQLLADKLSEFLMLKESQLVTGSGIFKRFAQMQTDNYASIGSEVTKTHGYGNELWFCTYAGAYRIDRNNKHRLTGYFKDQIVTHVLKDREGSYWFTTMGNGIFYVSSLMSRSLRNEQSPVLTGVTALMKAGDDELLFAGNHGTFGMMLGGQVSLDQMKSHVNRSMIKEIEKGYQPDQYLLSSDNALIEVVNGRVNRTTILLAKSILKWKDDLYAIGTNNRLLIVNHQQLDVILTMSEETFDESDLDNKPTEYSEYLSDGHHWITDIEAYEEGLLLGTLNGVLFLNADFKMSRLEGQEIEGKRINDIVVLEDGKSLAIATHGHGVLVKKGNEWRLVSEQEGLRSGISRRVWAGGTDTLWIASNRGVDQVVLRDPVEVKSITQSDGLMSEDVYDVLVSGDQLVAATSAGLSLVDLPRWRLEKEAPLINLKRVLVDGQRTVGDTLRIDFDNKEIRIGYDGIHFASMERLSYRYRMLGLDKAWQHTSNDEITFGRLLPGRYTFEVQAINLDGTLSDAVARQTLIVERPFWWQLWFLILAPLLLLTAIVWLTIFLVRRSKMKTQRALETRLRISETERRLLKAQVKPHFTYNILNSIQNMILKEETEKAYEFMGEFAALMRKDLDAYDQNSISLEEEIELLESYLRLEKLRFQEHEWTYEIVLEDNIRTAEVQVPPMFLQPFVENTIKHGFAQVDYPGKILIRGYAVENRLNFEVIDNGTGLIDKARDSYTSKGIAIVRKRLQLINDLNQVIVNDREDGHGVRVSIQMTL